MGVPVRIPREVAARKPPHGSPCNRCGLCCMVSLCELARTIFERPAFPGPCPALTMAPDGVATCGVVSTPHLFADPDHEHSDQELREAALLVIGGGYGCDARINGEPINERFEQKLRDYDQMKKTEIEAAKKLWNVKHERSD